MAEVVESRSSACEYCGAEPILDRTHSESIVVAASPQALYDVVSDVTRTGEWSPICRSCWWDEDSGGARVGAWFTGRNETPDRTWETRSEVVVADPGREFAFLVSGAYVRWGFTMAPAEGGGTVLTESWEFRHEGLQMFHDRFGDEAHARAKLRADQAHSGIPATLSAIKAIVESGTAR